MKGLMADIIGAIGCSFESLLAAASESLESPLELDEDEEEPEASLLELPAPLPLELDEDEEEPPPTRLWMKSWSRPASTCRAGSRQAARQTEQTMRVASLMGPSLALEDLIVCSSVVVVVAVVVVAAAAGVGVVDLELDICANLATFCDLQPAG